MTRCSRNWRPYRQLLRQTTARVELIVWWHQSPLATSFTKFGRYRGFIWNSGCVIGTAAYPSRMLSQPRATSQEYFSALLHKHPVPTGTSSTLNINIDVNCFESQ
jgi:hypothetical protein